MNIKEIEVAALLFELERGAKLGANELSSITEHGLSISNAPQMARSIQDYIETDPSADIRGSAYWALGKRYDMSLLNFFQSGLNRELERDPKVVYQIMIALDNLGEHVFSPNRSGVSFDEDHLNVIDAKAYLARLLKRQHL